MLLYELRDFDSQIFCVLENYLLIACNHFRPMNEVDELCFGFDSLIEKQNIIQRYIHGWVHCNNPMKIFAFSPFFYKNLFC